MAGFPSYIFVNIQPCLKNPTGFVKCFFYFWLAFSNHFLYMEKPLPAYDRHLNWLFGMFFHSQFKIYFHFLPFNQFSQLFSHRISSCSQIYPLFFSVVCSVSGWLFGWFFRIPLDYPAGNRLAFFYRYQPLIVIFKWLRRRTVRRFKAKPIIFLA